MAHIRELVATRMGSIMKKKLISFCTILLVVYYTSGQNSNSIPYRFSDSLTRLQLNDTAYYNKEQELSYIGKYTESLRAYDLERTDRLKYNKDLTEKQLNYFLSFKPINANEYIIQKAKTEQIIIINEAHHQPYNRVFTTSLLADLYEKGFRYFAVETIANNDKIIAELNENKYPTLKSGYYLKEPLYGNLVREALKVGFTVVGYESRLLSTNNGDGTSREIEQAKNINKILEKDPKAKILVHCGYDHVVESAYPAWGKAMAGRLFDLTGINPFTIDQIKLTEHSSNEFENPYFKLIHLDFPTILIDSNGNLFSGPSDNKQYDARIFLPRTKWINGRPNWLFFFNRSPYPIKNKITIGFPCLAFAYLETEFKQVNGNRNLLIPFDVIELADQRDTQDLSLKQGNYVIIIQNAKNQEQHLKMSVK